MKKVLAIVITVLMLGGCAKYVETNVAVFHEISAPIVKPTFVILASNEQTQSLEFQTYAKMVSDQLIARGFIEDRAQARYGVYLSYGIDGGREVYSSMPVYGHTWVGAYYPFRPARPGLYGGGMVMMPSYGVVGTQTRVDREYGSFLAIDMVDLATADHKVYEARVKGSSDIPFLGTVMPALVKSVFDDFPGQSGTTRSARIPLNPKQ